MPVHGAAGISFPRASSTANAHANPMFTPRGSETGFSLTSILHRLEPASSAGETAAGLEWLQNETPIPLVAAVILDDRASLVALVSQHSFVVDEQMQGRTAVWVSAMQGKHRCLEALIKLGANTDLCDKNGWSPAYISARHGNSECLKLLRDAHSDLSLPSSNGFTPAFTAARNGNAESLSILVDVGSANLGIPSSVDADGGLTLVWVAAYHGHTDCLAVLIKAGANIDTACNGQGTPLQAAQSNSHAACAEIIVEAINAAAEGEKAVAASGRPLQHVVAGGAERNGFFEGGEGSDGGGGGPLQGKEPCVDGEEKGVGEDGNKEEERAAAATATKQKADDYAASEAAATAAAAAAKKKEKAKEVDDAAAAATASAEAEATEKKNKALKAAADAVAEEQCRQAEAAVAERTRLLNRTPADFGVTFFARLSCAWAKVGLSMSVDGSTEIPVPEFMSACQELSNIYDCLGSFLSPAKKDMVSILGVLRDGDYNGSRTVQGIARADVEAGRCFCDNQDRAGLSFNLLWLSRALQFILALLKNIDRNNPAFASKECSDCAQDAYASTIKPYHGWMMSGTFGVMMGQVPNRSAFMGDLALSGSEEQAYAELVQFVALAEPHVNAVHQFYLDNGLNDPWVA